ncbi:hypothetical protein NBRC116583_26790 [Arenicella sp. 4NH20-0111]|uniref:class I SAM-dependent methyltransferase n=1 Tax=Arenicella sp. 4NH20-0111 TaxID=3127648 RepID=UPI0031091872
MMSRNSISVAAYNEFVENSQGVYQRSSDARDFNYSDGESSERMLDDILEVAQDLSSESTELQKHIVDWPTEYHLSSTRANLLRALNLDGVTRVLELGCGCGSITRYLGEQEGMRVDAIEGSPVRAALAKKRCRDLDNVEICSANFNDIELPKDEYDLVLFVGVTEYAGRFSSAETDEEALHDLLAMGKAACTENGVVLVAIENRLGMKYALGANEDHYAVPFIGLDNYPNSTGIKTYSKHDWLTYIRDAGFDNHSLLLPFPDYKIPHLVMHESCDDEQVGNALKEVTSRDYNRPFSLGENEHRLWESLLQAGTLPEHSNSFLWLLGSGENALQKMVKKTCTSFDIPQLTYDLPSEPKPVEVMREQDVKLVEHLNAQITQLQTHSTNLENKVQLMSNSIGWRILNGLRRLLRKNTL